MSLIGGNLSIIWAELDWGQEALAPRWPLLNMPWKRSQHLCEQCLQSAHDLQPEVEMWLLHWVNSAVLWPTGTEQWHLAQTSGTGPQPGPWQCGLPPLIHLQLRFPLLASILQHLATFGEGWHKYHYLHSAMGCSRKKEITGWCCVKDFQIRLQNRVGQSRWQWQWNWEKRRSVLLPCMHSSKFFLLESNYIYPGDFTVPQDKKKNQNSLKIGFV